MHATSSIFIKTPSPSSDLDDQVHHLIFRFGSPIVLFPSIIFQIRSGSCFRFASWIRSWSCFWSLQVGSLWEVIAGVSCNAPLVTMALTFNRLLLSIALGGISNQWTQIISSIGQPPQNGTFLHSSQPVNISMTDHPCSTRRVIGAVLEGWSCSTSRLIGKY